MLITVAMVIMVNTNKVSEYVDFLLPDSDGEPPFFVTGSLGGVCAGGVATVAMENGEVRAG
jgi:hypothetical protein